VSVTSTDPEMLSVRGLSPEQIGDIARDHRLAIYELRTERASLEEAFMEMTADSVEYHTSTLEGSAA
jgi:ABC-2 type transport system ATP-binding protein